MLQWHSAAPFDLPFLITATEERRAGDGGREEEGWSTPGTLRVELETRGPVSLSAAPLLSSYCFFSYLFSPLLPPWPGVCVSGWNGGLCLSAASLLLTRDRQRHLSTNTHTLTIIPVLAWWWIIHSVVCTITHTGIQRWPLQCAPSSLLWLHLL